MNDARSCIEEVMMFPDSILNLTALAFLGMAIPMPLGEDFAGGRCLPIVTGSTSASATAIVPDAGGYSVTANQMLAEPAIFLKAFIEGADGKPHPAMPVGESELMLLVTMDDRYVLRILNYKPAGRAVVDASAN
jgi:hypothetical protein